MMWINRSTNRWHLLQWSVILIIFGIQCKHRQFLTLYPLSQHKTTYNGDKVCTKQKWSQHKTTYNHKKISMKMKIKYSTTMSRYWKNVLWCISLQRYLWCASVFILIYLITVSVLYFELIDLFVWTMSMYVQRPRTVLDW